MQSVLPDSPSVAVIGAGAVGAFYGSMLQRYGLPVEYLSATMAKTKFLEVHSPWAHYTLPVKCFASPHEMKPADLVVVSLKALPDLDPFPLVTPVLKKTGVILLLQNGINQEERYAAYFSKTALRPVILGGLAFTCINRIDAAHIEHIDYGMVKIGALKKEENRTAKQAAILFQNAGIQCEYVPDLRRARYEKLLWNAAYNTLSVLLQASTDLIVSNHSTASLSLRIMREIRAIAAAENIRLSEATLRDMLDRTRRMRPYKTSMLLDFEAGRPMEIDVILGEPIRMACRRKIEVPHLQMAFDILQFYNHRNPSQKPAESR
jgi:2-dehydropantoate 2-reductase